MFERQVVNDEDKIAKYLTAIMLKLAIKQIPQTLQRHNISAFMSFTINGVKASLKNSTCTPPYPYRQTK